MEEKKKKKGFLFKMAVLPLVFLATFLLLLIGAGFLARSEYLKWESTFENELFEEDFLYPKSDKAEEINTVVTAKLEDFQGSDEKVDFIELEEEEFILLLHNVVEGSLSENLAIERYYIEPEEGLWSVYVEISYRGVTLPWLKIVVEKDFIETPELFVSGLYLGGIDLADWGFEFLINDINQGYSDAVLTINESALTKRRWENITLGEESVVIKGRLNE